VHFPHADTRHKHTNTMHVVCPLHRSYRPPSIYLGFTTSAMATLPLPPQWSGASRLEEGTTAVGRGDLLVKSILSLRYVGPVVPTLPATCPLLRSAAGTTARPNSLIQSSTRRFQEEPSSRRRHNGSLPLVKITLARSTPRLPTKPVHILDIAKLSSTSATSFQCPVENRVRLPKTTSSSSNPGTPRVTTMAVTWCSSASVTSNSSP